MSMEQDAGARVRKRNFIISIISTVVFAGGLIWFLRSGVDPDQIRQFLEKCGPLAPVLFIAISVFSSYIPIVPMGSMGSIGIVLFGPVPAFSSTMPLQSSTVPWGSGWRRNSATG